MTDFVKCYNELYKISGYGISNSMGSKYKSVSSIIKALNELKKSPWWHIEKVNKPEYVKCLVKHEIVEPLDKRYYLRLCSLFHPDTNSSKYAIQEYQRVQEWWAECIRLHMVSEFFTFKG